MSLEMLSLVVGAAVFLATFLRSSDRSDEGNARAFTRAIILTMGAMLCTFAIGIVAGVA